MNQEERLHSKSFIRIKIVQTFGKDNGLSDQLLPTMTIYMILDSNQSTHFIRSQSLTLKSTLYSNTSLKWHLGFCIGPSLSFTLPIFFLYFLNIPRDVDP